MSYWNTAPRPEDAAAMLKVESVRAALAERKPLCRQCLNIFDPHPRSFAETFECRSILMLPDSEPDPMLCDGCFRSIVESFNRQATNIGTSNSQPTNLVLAKLG